MRIAAICESIPAAVYRMAYPAAALQARGHEVLLPNQSTGNANSADVTAADLVLVYRRADERTRNLVRRLSQNGTAIVWDNDDDFRHLPKVRQVKRGVGGRSNAAVFSEVMRTARLADIVITTSEPIADSYREAGLTELEVIENYLAPRVSRKTRKHDGIVVGWVAGLEHVHDIAELGLVDVFQRLLDEHPDLHVEMLGVDLGITHDRYRHTLMTPFSLLPDTMAGFDIGIAPLRDTPFNRARSNIKVKEYAASRVPWLASPVGPYAGLGPDQGGRLVADGDWYSALDALIRDRRARKRLARSGRSWSKRQTIEVVGDRYEAIFARALDLAAERGRALVTA